MTKADVELRELITEWRVKFVELIQDRHSHGITSEQLKEADNGIMRFIATERKKAVQQFAAEVKEQADSADSIERNNDSGYAVMVVPVAAIDEALKSYES